jgi:hypothetical protein
VRVTLNQLQQLLHFDNFILAIGIGSSSFYNYQQ